MCLLLALLAAPMFAGEKEQANAKALLAGLTEVKESALGKDELLVTMMGIEVGKFTVEITKGEHGGKVCYVFQGTGWLTVGGIKRDLKTTAHIAPDMALLAEEGTQSDDGELVESMKYTFAEGAYKVQVIDKEAKVEADRDQTFDLKAEAGTLLGATKILLLRLLPAEAKAYEFREWDHDANMFFPLTMTVEAEKDGVLRVSQKGTEAKKDDEGDVTTEIRTTVGVLKAGKFVKVELGNNVVLTTESPAKRTAITAEIGAKLEKETAPVALFFRASLKRDQEMLEKAVDLERFKDTILDRNEMTKGMTKEQRDEVKALHLANLGEQLMGPEKEQTAKEKKRDAGGIDLLLHEENFVISKAEGEQKTVVFTDEVQKVVGNLVFTVEKNKDGKWRIVFIERKEAEAATED